MTNLLKKAVFFLLSFLAFLQVGLQANQPLQVSFADLQEDKQNTALFASLSDGNGIIINVAPGDLFSKKRLQKMARNVVGSFPYCEDEKCFTKEIRASQIFYLGATPEAMKKLSFPCSPEIRSLLKSRHVKTKQFFQHCFPDKNISVVLCDTDSGQNDVFLPQERDGSLEIKDVHSLTKNDSAKSNYLLKGGALALVLCLLVGNEHLSKNHLSSKDCTDKPLGNKNGDCRILHHNDSNPFILSNCSYGVAHQSIIKFSELGNNSDHNNTQDQANGHFMNFNDFALEAYSDGDFCDCENMMCMLKQFKLVFSGLKQPLLEYSKVETIDNLKRFQLSLILEIKENESKGKKINLTFNLTYNNPCINEPVRSSKNKNLVPDVEDRLLSAAYNVVSKIKQIGSDCFQVDYIKKSNIVLKNKAFFTQNIKTRKS